MNNIDISLAGEYFVASQMHMKGWTASMTLKNYPDIDIFGYNPQLGKESYVQVKTGCNKYNVLIGLDTANFASKIKKIKQAYVFVHINANCQVDCYVLSPTDFINLATQEYNGMSIPGNGKKAPLRFKWSSLQPYKDKWQNLW